MSIGMCTIAAGNYIAYARVLAQSYLKQHPEGKAYVLLVDRDLPPGRKHDEGFEWIRMDQIGIPDMEAFCFQYEITELCTAVKPYLLDYLLKEKKLEQVLYFDPDIWIMGRLDELYRQLNAHTAVLTPHLTAPIPMDGRRPSEQDIMKAGVYNLGFIGVSAGGEGDRFLQWWKQRLRRHCLAAVEEGLFVDQKWIDLAPHMFAPFAVIRDPGYNMAYWNLHERRLEAHGGEWIVNGRPLVFYHFSGFHRSLQHISKYQDRYDWKSQPALLKLFEQYREAVMRSGFEAVKDLQCPFNYFDNGMRIPDYVKRMYYRLGEQEVRRFGNPFQTGPEGSFYRYIFSPVHERTTVPVLVHELYQLRPDLQAAFPRPFDADQRRLLNWARINIPKTYSVDQRFMQF
ncbi:hypothetical protein [Paenibacillus tarimensis]|uniref:hypothetical protein n=1 Tax=Paenibacillus tarimensis TaxID=416012 RepID=UPI001F212800|nr:hypothetical protein [Paenibacillus tarimensis]MCF2944911.1 hypothetical protein [Paenibacillus tarimensis]